MKKKNFNSLFPHCFYLSDDLPNFINSDWWLTKSKSYYEILFPDDSIEDSLFSEKFVNLKILNKAKAAKICLLKALSEKYDLIFLDEIDSNFDQDAQKQYLELLNLINTNGNTIVICVSHQIERSNLICLDGIIKNQQN